MPLRYHRSPTGRLIGRSVFGAALLVTALSTLPGTAMASTPAPPPPAPGPPAESVTATTAPVPQSPPRRAAPAPAPAEGPQVRAPRGAPATGGGSADTGTDGSDAWPLALGAVGLAGAAGVTLTRRRRTTRA